MTEWGVTDSNPGSVVPESQVLDHDVLLPPLSVHRLCGQGVLQGSDRNYEHVDSMLMVEMEQPLDLILEAE